MSNQGSSNKSCKCDPCKCKDCKCNDIEFIEKDLAVGGNLFVKEDAYVAGNLHIKGRIIDQSSSGAGLLLPEIVNGQALFRVDNVIINGQLASFFLPSGTEDEVVTVVLDQSFVLANIGKRLSFILAPLHSGDSFRGIFTITSPYLDVAGDPTIRTFQIVRNNPFIVEVFIVATVQGPIVIVSELGAIANPALANPISTIASFGSF